MRYDAKKAFVNLKEKMIEEQIKRVSSELKSSNGLAVAVTFSELKKLKDRWHVQESIDALSRIEEPVIMAALRYLSSVEYPITFKEIENLLKKSEKIRRELAHLALSMPPDDACKLIAFLLKDRSPIVKIQALKGIEKIQCNEGVEIAKQLVKDEEPKVKIEAVKVLLNLGEDIDEKTISEIAEDTKLPFEIRTSALRILVMHFNNSLPILKQMAESAYSKLNSTALLLMGQFKCEEVWENLMMILSNDALPTETLEAALKSASGACKDRKEIEEIAAKYVRYPSRTLKMVALKTLIKAESPNVEDIIEEFLESNDRNLKLSVVPFVEEYPSRTNVDLLLTSLEDNDEEMIERSLKVLGKLKIKDERIRNMLFEHTLKIRIQSLRALVSSGDVDPEELMEFVKSASEPFELKIEALNGIAKTAPQRLEELL